MHYAGAIIIEKKQKPTTTNPTKQTNQKKPEKKNVVSFHDKIIKFQRVEFSVVRPTDRTGM